MFRNIGAACAGVLIMTGIVNAEVEPAKPFGKTTEGAPVEYYTLKNKNGVIAKVMTLGATLIELDVPDKQGKAVNVVLGFDSPEGYQSNKNQYFGATTGRVANRIANGKFKLDGKDYKLALNDGPNHLHGGLKRSLEKVIWKGETTKQAGAEGVQFTYTSPDGEEGYPGTLQLNVTYSLSDKNELRIDYSAKTDKATPVNLTNHSYFNLEGAGSETVLDHELMVAANAYLPVNETMIPTGKLERVKGTVFDFTTPTRIGARIDKLYKTGGKGEGYDHCLVLTPRGKEPTVAAKLRDPKSGRVMTVLTTAPGIQVYSGNFLFGQSGKDGKVYKVRSALCLETAHFPDAVNQPAFPPIILRPGQTYRQTCVYAFSTE